MPPTGSSSTTHEVTTQVPSGKRRSPKSVPVRTTTSLSGSASRRRPAGTSGAQSSRIGDESTRCDMQARLLAPGPSRGSRASPRTTFRRSRRLNDVHRVETRHRQAQRIAYTPGAMGARSLLLVAACLVFSPALEARELVLRYDGYYLVFRVISIDAVSSVQPAAYRTNMTLRTTGLLRAFGRWESTATATGAVDGAFLRPAFYGASSAFRDRRQR